MLSLSPVNYEFVCILAWHCLFWSDLDKISPSSGPISLQLVNLLRVLPYILSYKYYQPTRAQLGNGDTLSRSRAEILTIKNTDRIVWSGDRLSFILTQTFFNKRFTITKPQPHIGTYYNFIYIFIDLVWKSL